MNKTTLTHALEQVQAGFFWDENAEFPVKLKRHYWGDLFGSDWASGRGINLLEMSAVEAHDLLVAQAARQFR